MIRYLRDTKFFVSRLSGIVVSDIDCCAVGTGCSNPGEDMDACKCIVPSWHGGTLNSRRVASPLVRLVEEEEIYGALKATANEGLT
ncbi:hypothetical protein TNCV_4286231 [Trichonephila clavipes]|nr:hypothetical protein TNCV_4286231 [Trichonephila clavipes]